MPVKTGGEGEYRTALRTVREMLERAGSAGAVTADELLTRRIEVLTILARQRSLMGGYSSGLAARAAVTLSPDMEALIARLERDLVEGIAREIVSEPTAMIETPRGIVAA